MTSVNISTTKNTVTVDEDNPSVITVATLGPQGPAVPDGDKGDITVSNNGTVMTVDAGVINNAKIASDAAIALSKLATGALPTGITVASANIPDLTIINSDISASAAIAGTKISPDFGSQNIVTTGNITIADVTAASLDISGDVDVDGTLETDALTIDGVSLAETIADTVGAMVGSNTETGITVTYDDSDNTLDFVVGTLNQNTTGNAATATALQTARTINGVSFDGTGNITITSAADTLSGTTLNSSVVTSSLTSVGTLGSLAVTNAVTAGSLDISGGVDVDGTLEADAYTVNGTALNEYIADTVGGMVSGNTETNIAVTYDDADNTLDFSVVNITGNAATATALETARTIGGTSFDGSANIDISYDNLTNKLSVGDGGLTQNNFTDTLKTKLDGIETAATADQTASEIKTLLNSDGLVNAQVDASAAIAGTKISPDFGSQNITTTGNLGGKNLNLLHTAPTISLTDSNADSDFSIKVDGGLFKIIDVTNGDAPRFAINASGGITAYQNLDCDSGVDVIGNITVTGTVDGVDIATRDTLFGGLTSSSGVLTNGVTATTQSASDNSTKIATTAYTDTAIANLVDSSPSALNTLNELAAALGDDANFSTTVTNSIATKLPLAGGTLTGDTTFTDNTKLYFGTHSDFSISHNDTNATIDNDKGDLYITTTGSGDDIHIRAVDDVQIKVQTNENAVICSGNGAVELYYDNFKSFQTESDGVSVFGPEGTSAQLYFYADEGDDNADKYNIKVHQDGTGFYIRNQVSGSMETNFRTVGEGTCELYYDGTKKLETDPAGIKFNDDFYVLDGNKGYFGTGNDLQIYHDGTDSFLDSSTGELTPRSDVIRLRGKTANDTLAVFVEGGASKLYFDGTNKAQTYADGFNVLGDFLIDNQVNAGRDVWFDESADTFKFSTNVKATFGTGNDLQIYHSGSNSFIKHDGAGDLFIKTEGAAEDIYITSKDQIHLKVNSSAEDAIVCVANGGVQLYNADSKKFETTSDGAVSTGSLGISTQATGNPVENDTPTLAFFGAANDTVTSARIQAKFIGTQSGSSNPTELNFYTKPASLGPGSHPLLALTLDKDQNATFAGDVTTGPVFTVQGTEGVSANLYLIADDGDDNGDGWRINSNQDDNDLTISNNISGSYVDKLTLQNDGDLFTTGDVYLKNDSKKLKLGASDDLQIYFNGDNSYIKEPTAVAGQLIIDSWNGTDIRQGETGDLMGRFVGGDSVKLYWDGESKFETTSDGAKVTGRLKIQNGLTTAPTMLIGANNGGSGMSNNSTKHANICAPQYLSDTQTGGFRLLSAYGNDGANYVYIGGNSDNVSGTDSHPKSATEVRIFTSATATGNGVQALKIDSSQNATFAGDVSLPDDKKFIAGSGADLQIYHNGSHSYIKDTGTGDLFICSDDLHIGNAANDEDMAVFKEDAQVELYYDNSKKFETDSLGTVITGRMLFGDSANVNDHRIKFGDSGDLQIYHDGSNSYIDDGGAGRIFIESNSGVTLQTSNGAETTAQFNNGGAVELYYDGDKQCETNSGGMNWADGKRAYFGNSSDLQIYHDGSNSFISEAGTGVLKISGSAGVYINKHDNTETCAAFLHDAAVELYYDNSKKLETFSWGVQNYGNVAFRDSDKATFGASEDLQIYHDGTNNVFDHIDGSSTRFMHGNEKMLVMTPDSHVELYWDNSKKLHTVSGGIYVTGNVYANNTGTTAAFSCTDNGRSAWGSSNDLQIYHDGSTNIIDGQYHPIELRHQSEVHIKCVDDGAVELYYDNVKKLSTKSDGIEVDGFIYATRLDLDDNEKILVGTGDDLQIYHDGSYNRFTGANYVFMNAAANEYIFEGYENGAVKLYYDNVNKLETTSYGFTSSGYSSIGDGTWAYLTGDSNKSAWGDNQDLQIYHDGSNSFIDDNGTGNLVIRSSTISFENAPGGGEERLRIASDGEVGINVNPSSGQMLAITGRSGYDDIVQVTAVGTNMGPRINLTSTGNGVARINATNNTLSLQRGGTSGITIDANNAVELYYDDSKKFETNSGGVTAYASAKILGASGADAQLYMYSNAQGSNSDCWKMMALNSNKYFYIQNYTDGAWETNAIFKGGNNVQLYYDNSKKFETSATGIKIHGLDTGAGNSDLRYSSSDGVVTYDTSSRLVKTDIEDSPYGIDIVKQLKPRKYKRTDQQDTPIEIGFVADEVQSLIPEIVPTGPKSIFTKNNSDTEIIPVNVDYRKLTVVLTTALQEAITRIETLETEVAALKAGS